MPRITPQSWFTRFSTLITSSEISARCDREEANFLALNLAYEIVQDQLRTDLPELATGDTVWQKEMPSSVHAPPVVMGGLFDTPGLAIGPVLFIHSFRHDYSPCSSAAELRRKRVRANPIAAALLASRTGCSRPRRSSRPT